MNYLVLCAIEKGITDIHLMDFHTLLHTNCKRDTESRGTSGWGLHFVKVHTGLLHASLSSKLGLVLEEITVCIIFFLEYLEGAQKRLIFRSWNNLPHFETRNGFELDIDGMLPFFGLE